MHERRWEIPTATNQLRRGQGTRPEEVVGQEVSQVLPRPGLKGGRGELGPLHGPPTTRPKGGRGGQGSIPSPSHVN